jgi:hypothetical protein
MKKLKETLSKSLKAFEGKGLTVTERDGKVYVSMENKLLFESGSWTVGTEGKKVVDLGLVERAKAINGVAKNIIDNAKTTLDAMQYTYEKLDRNTIMPDQFKLKEAN